MSPRRVALVVVASATLVASTGGIARGAPPPTLNGETLATDVEARAFDCNGGTFDGTGDASGPFAGTNQQTGSLNMTVGTSSSKVSKLTDAFTITAPNGKATGKVYLLPRPPSSARCEFTSEDVGDGEHSIDCLRFFADATTGYQAIIDTGTGGRFLDLGTAAYSLGGVNCTSIFAGDFREAHVGLTFKSLLKVPLPTTRDQCKKDGWRAFRLFRNQGQCVLLVTVFRL
jgi:hypothetical protein